MAIVKVEEAKSLTPGREVSLIAMVLRTWQVRDSGMCLVGDETGLMRIGLGDGNALQSGRGDLAPTGQVQEGCTYLFEGLAVRVYTGGWHSLELSAYGRVLASDQPISVTADEKYIQQVYKILTGLERKRQRLGAKI